MSKQLTRGGSTLYLIVAASFVLTCIFYVMESAARPGFGGMGGMRFGGAHFNIGGGFHGGFRPGGLGMRPIDRPIERPIDRPIDRPIQRPIQRPIDRPIHVHPNGHYHDHYWPYPRPGYWAGAAVGAAAAAGAIGSIVYSLPPACVREVIGGVVYESCEGTWYRPSYAGTQVVYEVVEAPR